MATIKDQIDQLIAKQDDLSDRLQALADKGVNVDLTPVLDAQKTAEQHIEKIEGEFSETPTSTPAPTPNPAA